MKTRSLIDALKQSADSLGLFVEEQQARNHQRIIIFNKKDDGTVVRVASIILKKNQSEIPNAVLRKVISSLSMRAETSLPLDDEPNFSAKLLEDLMPRLKGYPASFTDYGFKSKKLRSKLGRY